MKKKSLVLAVISLLAVSMLTACKDEKDSSNGGEAEVTNEASVDADTLADGTYKAVFTTDSSMFHVNEEYDDYGTLTVKDGKMTIHITLSSKKIVNLYPGLAADAAEDDAELLMPTEDTVNYSDGTTETVYGFDVPVPAIDEEFDLALLGSKGKWYDHKVKVSNPEIVQE